MDGARPGRVGGPASPAYLRNSAKLFRSYGSYGIDRHPSMSVMKRLIKTVNR
jgi:hypothetical protein